MRAAASLAICNTLDKMTTTQDEPASTTDTQGRTEAQPLKDQVSNCLEEARMVLPGIQALFGFQLIAVFNQQFSELGALEQLLHYVAIVLVTSSTALVITPAAVHRLAYRGEVSAHFVALASRLITSAMVPLALAIALDTGVVGFVITESWLTSGCVAAAVAATFFGLWFVLPLRERMSSERSSG